MKRIYLFIGILFAIAMSACLGEKPTVSSLKVEMQENPEGVVSTRPRFSWQIASNTPDLMQTAYQIQLASSEEVLRQGNNLLWDTKKVKNDQSILIPYEGSELSSRQVCFWRVKVFTNRGNSDWSAIGRWSMALLNDADWQAKWIAEDSLSNSGETMKGDTRLAHVLTQSLYYRQRSEKSCSLYFWIGVKRSLHQRETRVGRRFCSYCFVVSRKSLF
jgi:alpha-L-rhamnosidase